MRTSLCALAALGRALVSAPGVEASVSSSARPVDTRQSSLRFVFFFLKAVSLFYVVKILRQYGLYVQSTSLGVLSERMGSSLVILRGRMGSSEDGFVPCDSTREDGFVPY